MRCQRCHGWMVSDYFMDLLSGGDELDFTGWRCLNCGAITDPVINARAPAASGRSREVDTARWWRATQSYIPVREEAQKE